MLQNIPTYTAEASPPDLPVRGRDALTAGVADLWNGELRMWNRGFVFAAAFAE